MFEVEVTAVFSAAHRLRDYNGKCERLHGHNYRVQAAARSAAPKSGGMVIDFTELKKSLNAVLDILDHNYLNDIKPFDDIEPSAENLAAFIFERMEEQLGGDGRMLHSVSVWESDTSRATFIRD
jgi:6-pyruvoyltetrahydropterin/6-carboxytetrahydropterin synthase